MGHKKESCDHDERRKCRRQSNLPSTKRVRKNRSCSMSISVESFSTFSEKGDQLENCDVIFFLEYLVLYFHNKLLYLIM